MYSMIPFPQPIQTYVGVLDIGLIIVQEGCLHSPLVAVHPFVPRDSGPLDQHGEFP